jgi:glycine hydroxymethyltransferase
LISGGLKLVSGGTDNHLMLVDVTGLGYGGKTATEVLEKCGITVNMNMIPYDTRKPMDPSGIRVGTPALTTRGMGVQEMRQIGQWMLLALKNPQDASQQTKIRSEVSSLCQQFPVPAAKR